MSPPAFCIYTVTWQAGCVALTLWRELLVYYPRDTKGSSYKLVCNGPPGVDASRM